MKCLVIGIDIGGTRTKSGLVNIETGKTMLSMIHPTEKKDELIFLQQMDKVIDLFEEFAAENGNTIMGIGIGVPGFTGCNGVVATTYGFLEFMENYPLKTLIEKRLLLPCFIDNDARVVALGEAHYGLGKDYKRILTLTLGTGVGFGFIVNGHVTEPLPLAHMGGHIKINNEGQRCYCGKTGCLEALVSSTGIISMAKNKKTFDADVSVETIFAMAAEGNNDAIEIVEKVCNYLHDGIHNYVNLFAPDIIVLGGGIAKGLSPYLKKIIGKSYLSPYPGYSVKLAISTLQESAGVLGSAALFKSIDNLQIIE